MSFSLLLSERRRTIKAPVNPLDKCTIISIFPFAVKEVQYTTSPSVYNIPVGSLANPAVLVVGPASWWREVDPQQPLIEIVNSSIQVADAVVKNYCSGLLECEMGNQQPGLFYVEGVCGPAKMKEPEMQARLKHADILQRNWYTALIRHADMLWARTNGNPISISNDMRRAAEELGILDKPWMQDFSSIQMVKCIACGSLRNPEFPVCPTCKAVSDPEKAKKLGITFAN